MMPPARPPAAVERDRRLPRSSIARRIVARRRLFSLWLVLALLAASGVWAQSSGGGVTAAVRAFVYLTLCGAVLLLPGYLLERAGLETATLRLVSLVTLIASAGLAAGTIVVGASWVTPPLILLAGNAIWTLDTIDLESEMRRRRAALPPD